jgi:hypothetical protein
VSRKNKRRCDYLERAGYRTHHHIKAKSKGGKRTRQNLILLDERRHSAFHLLFGTRTLLQAAEVLIRTDDMKRRQ